MAASKSGGENKDWIVETEHPHKYGLGLNRKVLGIRLYM